jgi:CheY-like chemotaxis protein
MPLRGESRGDPTPVQKRERGFTRAPVTCRETRSAYGRSVRGVSMREVVAQSTGRLAMVVFDSMRRILIVDDDNRSARQIEQYLRAMGHDVVETVKSADEAITAATLHKPDLIIMEVHTSPRDGVEAAKEIYSKLRIRCLLASGKIDGATRARAAAAQPLGWLTKPYSPENFLLVLWTALLRLG